MPVGAIEPSLSYFELVGDKIYTRFEGPDSAVGEQLWQFDLPDAATPGRVFASRASDETVDGVFEGGGRVGAGSFAEVDIAGRAGVPSDGAGSVVMNITSINPDGRGFITTYPCGDRPLASSLNYGAAGAVIGNELVAKLSPAGTVCVYTSAATDLTVDVVGYVPT